MITSTSNPEVRAAAALRDRSERERTNLFLIEGEIEVGRAVKAGIEIETLYVREGEITGLRDQIRRVLTVSDRAFERIAYGRGGVVAVGRRPRFRLEDLRLPGPELLIIVEGLEKPGNLGAILRTADAIGAGLIAVTPATDLTNPNVVRASLGTIFTAQVASSSVSEVVEYLAKRNIALALALVQGGVPPWQADLTKPLAIAIGSEQSGLSPALIGASDVSLTLPMIGSADSLNASATAAVLLYETVRQRAQGSPGNP